MGTRFLGRLLISSIIVVASIGLATAQAEIISPRLGAGAGHVQMAGDPILPPPTHTTPIRVWRVRRALPHHGERARVR